MTTRFSGLLVVLENDMREDDAQPLIDAIIQLRGVVRVSGCELTSEQRTRELRLRTKLGIALAEYARKIIAEEAP